MLQSWLRNLGWLSVFNFAGALICGKAAVRAASNHDFLWASIFALIGCTYLFGVGLSIIQHRCAAPLNHRMRAAGLYFFAAFNTALTVDDLMYMAEASGRPFSGWTHVVLTTSQFGSLGLGIASLATLFRPRLGNIAALTCAVVLCPYFAWVACDLPWRDFVWLVTIHWDGELEVTAIFSLTAALAYSIFQLWCGNVRLSLPKGHA